MASSEGMCIDLESFEPELKWQQAYGIYNGVWMGILFAVVIALILHSTPRLRRGPVFWIQCLTFIMAFANALLVTMNVVLIFRQIFYCVSATTLTNLAVSQKAFQFFTPLISDSTLIFKVLAFYPAALATGSDRWRRVLVVFPLLLLGVARLGVCISVCIYYWRYNVENVIQVDLPVARAYYDSVTAEFVLQIVYCSYASAILFRKIYTFAKHRKLSRLRPPAVQRKLRFLIESLAMTFALPVVVQLIALIATCVKKYDLLYLASITNVYLSVLMSVLATTWSTIRTAHVRHRDDGQGSGSAEAKRQPFPAGGKIGQDAGSMRPVHPSSTAIGGDEKPGRSESTGHSDELNHQTILASLFDDREEPATGQSTQIEILSSVPRSQLDAETHASLPPRYTSSWRRGLSRTWPPSNA